MTPSIGKNQIKSKLDIFFAHHTRGQKVHEVYVGVHSKPKPKRGIIIKTSKKHFFIRFANCIKSFSFHEQNQFFPLAQNSMEQERPHNEPEISSLKGYEGYFGS